MNDYRLDRAASPRDARPSNGYSDSPARGERRLRAFDDDCNRCPGCLTFRYQHALREHLRVLLETRTPLVSVCHATIAGMTRFSFTTATTVNGFLATANDSLEWLFAVAGEQPDSSELMTATSVVVMGSITYEWVLRQESILNEPSKWQGFFGARPVFVFSTRALPAPDGADVRFVSGSVAGHVAAIRQAAGNGTVWVQGGGDLAGQFLDAGTLDEITLHIAPAFLAAGRSLLPRDITSEQLTLSEVKQTGQFATLRYTVNRAS